MRAFIAFTKKECTENIRTFRFVILASVLLFFGILSPLTAKLLPELLGSIDMGGGIMITLPDPTAIDSWTQFFSNIGQMGMLALIITFSGITANEISRGTLVNLLTKGMPRHTVILSKFLTASVIWTIGYVISLAVCYAYTMYYWPAESISNAFIAFFSLWFFGELMIAMLIFGGVLFGTFYGSLLSCFGVIITMSLISIAPATQKYNPQSLAGATLGLLNDQSKISDFIPALIICAIAIVIFLVASILVFNKKKL